ncbi:MAG: rRNA maturation RNase YbeY [Eubacterium sp.]
MNIYIENEYKNTIDMDYKSIITSVVREAVEFVDCPYECEINITITDNNTIQEINREQRNIDRPTDVLSFPLLEYDSPGDFTNVEEDLSSFNPDTGELLLGDIVISYDKVISQSEEYNHSAKRELAFLTAHSMLHLFGYDHMADSERMEMEEKQNLILKNLGITREN